jgi:MFS family permease
MPEPGTGKATKRLAVIYLFDWAGTGVLMTVAPVFFTGNHMLTAAQYAIALSVASIAGFVGSVPISKLADRLAVRTVLIWLYLWRAAAVLSLMFASAPVMVAVSFTLLTIADRPSGPLLQALAGTVSSSDKRVRTMAMARTAANLGMAFGSLAGAGLLVTGGHWPLWGAVLVDSLSFLVAGTLIAVTAAGDRTERPAPRLALDGRAAMGDGGFLWLTTLNGVLGFHKPLLLTAIPLWLTTRTQVPPYWVGLLMVINTGLVVLLQIRLSRGSETLPGAARALGTAGVCMALACVWIAVAAQVTVGIAVIAMVAATVFVTLAEILQSAGAWGVSFAYAPPARRAEYLAVFNLGNGARDITGPPLLTVVVFPLAVVGWAGLAVLIAGSGALLSRRVRRQRVWTQSAVSTSIR